jgi:hypothetical protein
VFGGDFIRKCIQPGFARPCDDTIESVFARTFPQMDLSSLGESTPMPPKLPAVKNYAELFLPER